MFGWSVTYWSEKETDTYSIGSFFGVLWYERLRILQLKLRRARLAQKVAWHDLTSHAVDLMIISEPNVKIYSREGRSSDKKNYIAIRMGIRTLEVVELK